MTKFPERSKVGLFSLQEGLCFHVNVIGSFIQKKSLISFVLDKHLQWFVFLHFDLVQIISLLLALHRFSLLSSQAAQALKMIILRNDSHGETRGVCIGIFTTALRNNKISQILTKNTSPYFQSALLAI